MWWIPFALATEPEPVPAPPPEASAAVLLPDPLEEARRHTSRGWAETGVGLGAAAGGVFVLSYQRGEDGGLSDEEPWVMDLRSIGGALLTMGGLTTLIAGGHDLSLGHRLRAQAVSVRPVWWGEGAGAVVEARF